MKYLLLCLLPSFALAQSDMIETDWRLELYTQGTIAKKNQFESIGRAMIVSADTLLQPHGGFQKLYSQYQKDPSSKLNLGVWQNAEAFRQKLLECNIDVPTHVLAMKLGMKAIFDSKTDAEIDSTLHELGEKLSYEQKIAFASQLGGQLSRGYDNARTNSKDDASKGAVTFRDMITAYQTGKKAGVCRDMAFAMANSLDKMGVPSSFIVAYQLPDSGHATVISQDPNDPTKTYNINYSYVTSSEGGNALTHLKQDSTLPGVGIDYRIYSGKDGHQLTALPSNLGLLLHEMGGGKASDLDPMLKSETSFASIGVAKGGDDRFALSIAKGFTPDGDNVNAIVGSIKDNSEHFPSQSSLIIYQNKKDADLYGKMETYGLYIDGKQTIQSSPLTIKSKSGEAKVQFFGAVGLNLNISKTYMDEKLYPMDKSFSAGSGISIQAGTKTSYSSTSGDTKIGASVVGTGEYSYKDVRNQGKGAPMTFNLRDVTGSVVVSQKISEGVSGFARGTVTARQKELGMQSSQEIGVNFKILGKNGEVVVGHEGKIMGPTLAFVPGSLERNYVDFALKDSRDNTISGGVFCSTQGRKDCGVRIKGLVKLGGRPRS